MGSLAQLHSTDEQDTVLLSSRHSFFTQEYYQYHHFATEHRQVTFDRNDNRVVITIPRVADLLTGMMLTATMEKTEDLDADQWMYPIESAIDRMQLVVGGMVVEEHVSTFCRIYDEIYRSMMKRLSYANMGNFDKNDPVGTVKTLYMPLPFPCCTPLPLIGLSFAEVELIVHLKPGSTITQLGLECEYVYCLPDDRKQWMQPTELQIKQVQHLSFPLHPHHFDTEKVHNFTLDEFNHPVYKIIVAATHKDRHGAFTGSGRTFEDAEAYAPILKARLVISGQNTLPWVHGSFRRQMNIFSEKLLPSAGVYVFDMGFGGGKGTLNMSKIQSAVLQVVFKNNVQDTSTDDQEGIGLYDLTELHVFALNYNWLKVAEGQGGIMFSN